MKPQLIVFPMMRKEIETQSIHRLKEFIQSIERCGGKEHRQSIILLIDGYNDVIDELYEIPEVRAYLQKVIHEMPYLFYYLRPQGLQSEKNSFNGVTFIIFSLSDDVRTFFRGECKVLSEYTDPKQLPKVDTYFKLSPEWKSKIINSLIAYGIQLKDDLNARKIAAQYNEIL